ncbi:MAG TPA: DUF4382 domain-containing protein [Terriglobales bacterium]|jgi:hypothetical protein|nr:DUF4382 domain-containing protein [Terriglobales bacterium]
MKKFVILSALLACASFTLVACGGGSSSDSGMTSGSSQAQVFVTGEDAPLPSVLAFNITMSGIALNNSSGSVQLLSEPTTVDFARLVGLRSLLGFNSVAAGTYNSVTFTMASPVITYLNLGTTPPSTGTINGTLTTSTVTVALDHPLTVDANGLAGLHMEFDLRQSLQVDMAGQVTGTVNPHIEVEPVKASDDDGQITELAGGLSTVNVGGNSFVIQRIGGKDVTIKVNSKTEFSGTWALATMMTPAFVSVEGSVQADGSVLASDVEVVSTTHAFVSGRIVAVNPTTGPVQTVTLFVGEELPAISTIPVDSIATIDVSTVNNFDVCFFDNWFTNIFFNNSALVAGQRVFIGGDYEGTTFTPHMVSLRRQGVEGDLVASSVQITSSNRGSFQIQNNHLLGYVLGAPLTVQTGDGTRFHNVNGLTGLQGAGSAKVLARGLILKDQSSGNAQLWAHHVRILQ